MKTIPLSQGLVAIVDDDDFELLAVHRLYAHKPKSTWYAVRNGKVSEGRSRFFMHRVITAASTGETVDNIDGDGLNNRRANLRLCTLQENALNLGRRIDNTSGYKGVRLRLHLKSRPWVATIQRDGKSYHLGCFLTAEEAARAYDEAAINLHGPFARLNFPRACPTADTS